MKFSGEYRVNANDMDVNSIVSASAVMRFMQDAAFSQMEDAGMSYGRLVSEYGAAFILSTLRLRLYAPLYSHDRIIGESWACPSRGVTFMRSHRILRGGAVMAEAVTAWALVGVTDKRLHRVGELALPYGEEEAIPIDTPTRLKIPAELAMPQVGTHTVTYTDIDSNGHMNNTKYPDLLCATSGICAAAVSRRFSCISSTKHRLAKPSASAAAVKPITPIICARSARTAPPMSKHRSHSHQWNKLPQKTAALPTTGITAVSYTPSEALYSSPQFHRESKIGFRLLPSGVREYSTRGGTSA